VKKHTFGTALKVGERAVKKIIQQVREANAEDAAGADMQTGQKHTMATDPKPAREHFVSSECPLAGDHIKQGLDIADAGVSRQVGESKHPIELLARAYGLS